MAEKTFSISEVKSIQIDILRSISEFCEQNHIKYSLACGTLLGAARHQGYIPWDDDIDIYIPREDYKRLIELFPPTYKDRYKIINLERDSDWNKPFAKAYDDKTWLIENAETCELGVNIDIFPVDDVPDDENEWLKYDRYRRLLQRFLALKYLKYNSDRPFVKNAFVYLTKILTFWIRCRQLAKIVDKFAQRYNGKGYKRCFESVLGNLQISPFPKVLFDDLKNIPFEHTEFWAFNNYDLYLTNGYGNWRKLPPLEKRVSHHSYVAGYKPKKKNG